MEALLSLKDTRFVRMSRSLETGDVIVNTYYTSHNGSIGAGQAAVFPVTSDLTPAYFRRQLLTTTYLTLYDCANPNVNFVLCPVAIMSPLAHRRPLHQAWIGKQEVDPDETQLFSQ